MTKLKMFSKLISYFFTFVIFLMSCSQYEEIESIENEELGSQTLFEKMQTFNRILDDHIAISEDFATLGLDQNLDQQFLAKSNAVVFNNKNLTDFYNKSNANNPIELAEANMAMHDNLLELYNFNLNNIGMDKEQFLKEIESYVNSYYENEIFSKSSSCAEDKLIGRQRCMRNYGIAAAVIVASTWWTVGVGTAIAIAGATTILTLCMNDTTTDYQSC